MSKRCRRRMPSADSGTCCETGGLPVSSFAGSTSSGPTSSTSSASSSVVVEADGALHFLPEGLEHDRVRDGYLARRGLRVLRFTDREVLLEPKTVEASILAQLGQVP